MLSGNPCQHSGDSIPFPGVVEDSLAPRDPFLDCLMRKVDLDTKTVQYDDVPSAGLFQQGIMCTGDEKVRSYMSGRPNLSFFARVWFIKHDGHS